VIASLWRWLTGRWSVEPASEHARVLAAYAAANARACEADREKRALRKQVDELPAEVVFDGWRKRLGTPKRIVDRDAAKSLLAERGLELPMRDAEPPLIVEYVGDQGED
jgi:hypothetical protein